MLSGLMPIALYLFIYYILSDPFIDGDYDFSNLLFAYVLIFVVAAGLTRDTAKNLNHKKHETNRIAYTAIAMTTGLVASIFFIDNQTYMLFGLALLLASQAIWLRTSSK